MTGIWLYAKKQGFINAGTENRLRAATRLYIFASIFSTLIWLVSYVSLVGCLLLFGLMFMVFIFPERIVSLQLYKIAKHRKVPLSANV